MPVYDYKCTDHGLFNQLATFEQSAQPCACPQCGQLSARVIVLPPELRGLQAHDHQAMERNERSRHEPVFSTPQERVERRARHEHKHGKGCCGETRRSALMYTADGKKMFPGMRPWMISH